MSEQQANAAATAAAAPTSAPATETPAPPQASDRFVRHLLRVDKCGRNASKPEIEAALSKVVGGELLKASSQPKRRPGENYFTLSFSNLDDLEKAMTAIRANPPSTSRRPEEKWDAYKLRQRPPMSNPNMKRVKRNQDGSMDADKTAKSAVAPWSDVPYEEQLEKKRAVIADAVAAWRTRLGLRHPLTVLPTTPAPENGGRFGYRNKIDLTIGFDAAGLPTAGFRVGSFTEGSTRVEGLSECAATCPAVALEFSIFATAFLRDSAALPPYSTTSHTGFWRTMTSRNSAKTKELMLVLRASALSSGQEAARAELARFVGAVKDLKFDGYSVTSIVMQWHEGASNAPAADAPFETAYGKDAVQEVLLDKTFRVSPGSFFQANSVGAELLFTMVRDRVSLELERLAPVQPLVLDVCCGTGVIGLLLLDDRIKRIVGVELSKSAVDDARLNAAANGIGEDRARFVCSKAETAMGRLMRASSGTPSGGSEWSHHEAKELSPVDMEQLRLIAAETPKDVAFVAVVDPPRAGLHPSVLKALRANPAVKSIVYVSCNPSGSFITDAGVLCQDSSTHVKGQAFRPVDAQPVDMFPHTEHCEMICTFTR